MTVSASALLGLLVLVPGQAIPPSSALPPLVANTTDARGHSLSVTHVQRMIPSLTAHHQVSPSSYQPTVATSTAPQGSRQIDTTAVPPRDAFLSTREQASLILLAIFSCYLLANRGLRAHIPRIFRASLQPAILVLLFLVFGYTSFEVWLGLKLTWWSDHLAKETAVWAVMSGTVLMYKGILEANHDPSFFRRTASATIAPTVFLTFFINLATFGLLAEIALQLLLIPTTMLSTFARASADPQHDRARKFCDGLLSLVALSWFTYTAVQVQRTWDQLDLHLLFQKLALPIWLTLGLLPFIYALSIYVAYQRPSGLIKSHTRSFWARSRALVAIILTLRFKVRDVTRLHHFWTKKAVDAKTFSAACSVVKEFEQSLRDEERAAAEEKDRLLRYAGVNGVDSAGQRLDRREFKETMKALEWLATCHAGHYRKRNRYDSNLLHLLGNSFAARGLPEDPGIIMKVANDGQRWFAFRRTVTGWHFAIGAAGPPPDRWEYDGPDPPSGFPGEDLSWGSRRFGGTENTNWA